ncbi:helix-turn-helix domain-containing protein [Methylobacterium sp. J-026]|uniref:helix-turn-helix domain-containing protein n=1 Tax=Methylobacterium sp. J-026 TaxID=2836624 RepID=UPI001FB9FBF1|nr:helix-turn-helix domain-containing protein [Methylobacterium sp. J-026]MCJ2134714.1 helix-turn-helix domain-containing protein [Methylobacterium sp. J-026]
MKTVFSTEGLHPRNAFKAWKDKISELGATVEQQRLDDSVFEAKMAVARVGSIAMNRSTMGAVRNEATTCLIPRHGDDGLVMATFTYAGRATSCQDDRSSVQRKGDLVVIDHRPTVLTTSRSSDCLVLQIPRARLESVLGPTRLYTSLTVGSEFASTSLALTFLNELIQVGHQMTPDAADRMASIGVDLIVASIAERIAREVPQPLYGTVVVQRAKAYIEAHLSDPTIDPPQLAAAVGVSLRRLQQLFHERGQHIYDWIWKRRLEVAAARLADPGCAHLPIGMLAYASGFTTRAHFSRRFKDQFGVSPSDFRLAKRLDGA